MKGRPWFRFDPGFAFDGDVVATGFGWAFPLILAALKQRNGTARDIDLKDSTICRVWGHPFIEPMAADGNSHVLRDAFAAVGLLVQVESGLWTYPHWDELQANPDGAARMRESRARRRGEEPGQSSTHSLAAVPATGPLRFGADDRHVLSLQDCEPRTASRPAGDMRAPSPLGGDEHVLTRFDDDAHDKQLLGGDAHAPSRPESDDHASPRGIGDANAVSPLNDRSPSASRQAGESNTPSPLDGDNRQDMTGPDVTGPDEIDHHPAPVTPPEAGRPRGTTGKARPAEIQGQAVAVFDHWARTFSKTGVAAKRDTAAGRKRLAQLAARLRDGYTVDQLKLAIDGCAKSPWHRGENPEGKVYDDLELICRPEKVERFIQEATATPRAATPNNHRRAHHAAGIYELTGMDRPEMRRVPDGEL
jgi:hypothetical protein